MQVNNNKEYKNFSKIVNTFYNEEIENISEEEIDKKNIAGLRKKKEFLLDCIEYFEWRKNINDRNTIALKLHNLGIDIEHNSREEMLRDIKNKLGETESQLWRPQLKLVRTV